MHPPQDELHGGTQDRRVESRGGQVELVRTVLVVDLLHAPPRDDDRRLVVPDDGEEERGGELNALHLGGRGEPERSEEHTSELQSLTNLVCRLLLEKKKK